MLGLLIHSPRVFLAEGRDTSLLEANVFVSAITPLETIAESLLRTPLNRRWKYIGRTSVNLFSFLINIFVQTYISAVLILAVALSHENTSSNCSVSAREKETVWLN